MKYSNDELKTIFRNNPITGVDFNDGLNRFGGQASIYLRIIRSFIANTPKTLELLVSPDQNNGEEYTIRVHGLKGSCYGISAISQGDEAKALEFASRENNWAAVERDNPKLIESVTKLIADLEELVRKLDEDATAQDDDRPLLDAPDRAVAQCLLDATKNFDVDAIRSAIEDLDKARYSFDSKLVSDLNQNLINFRYDLIEDKAQELLAKNA
jgi:HPt (histidine-containing phosphotransfer) domain-containing protein